MISPKGWDVTSLRSAAQRNRPTSIVSMWGGAPASSIVTNCAARGLETTGGRVSGVLDAEILPGGADWQVVRPDGTIEIDTRYSALTPAGECPLERIPDLWRQHAQEPGQ